MQGEGIRGPSSATPGSSITVNVGPNDSSVSVSDPVSQTTVSYDVEPGKDTTIQIPNVPGGTLIQVWAGKGINRKLITIEVVSPSP